MNILLLARWPVGGIRTYFRYVYGNPGFKGHHLTFVAPDQDLQALLERHLPAGSFRFIASKESNIDLFLKVARLLWQGDFGLVHSHGFTAGAIAAPLCRLFGVPHVMTAHDVFQSGQFVGIKGKVKRRLLAWLFRQIDRIHMVSEDGRRNFIEYFPDVDESRLCTIAHGIDVEAFSSATAADYRNTINGINRDAFLFGFFGRFMGQKGFRYLVEAVDILVNTRQLEGQVQVLTFGSGGFLREDYAAIERQGLSDCFVKMPHTDDMPAAIKSVDVVLMPSLWEACGLLAMESLVAGTPIIGTDCIGLREVLAGTPATVIPAADPTALADAMEQAMKVDRRNDFLTYAAEARKRFSPDRTVRELLELYDSMAP